MTSQLVLGVQRAGPQPYKGTSGTMQQFIRSKGSFTLVIAKVEAGNGAGPGHHSLSTEDNATKHRDESWGNLPSPQEFSVRS